MMAAVNCQLLSVTRVHTMTPGLTLMSVSDLLYPRIVFSSFRTIMYEKAKYSTNTEPF